MALRTGVLGLGKMGQHHVRCVARASGLELVGAADLDPSKQSLVPDGT
ncbi:MAG: gfo/Idh/MocA family oxidoreductase, partial [Gemmatimonadetes bacterium]|nr:gfo/Idh/MocA family oxidoreductase [Gemmatimonadota bacterium]